MEPTMVSVRPEAGGRRHPLLFVHGAWHGAWCWEGFQEWFAGHGWETHAVDLRGHGDAPSDRSLRRTRIHHYAEDITAAIAALDRPPILVAHSMGSLAAQKSLERVTLPGAILLAPIPLGGVWRTTFRVIRRHPIKFLKANLILDLRPLIEDATVASDLLLPDGAPAEDVEWLHDRLQAESYLAYIDMLFVVRAHPALVGTPVAVVAGAQDRLFSVKELRRLAGAYGTELRVLEESAHDVMLGPGWQRAAATVAEALEAFE